MDERIKELARLKLNHGGMSAAFLGLVAGLVACRVSEAPSLLCLFSGPVISCQKVHHQFFTAAGVPQVVDAGVAMMLPRFRPLNMHTSAPSPKPQPKVFKPWW
ncbi:hypothetical protein TYRP_023379 [Tyrophagus putrescentiae]|nr:hypothetical protein TYRP_023379 [Tyrophagus putrescentiae]